MGAAFTQVMEGSSWAGDGTEVGTPDPSVHLSMPTASSSSSRKGHPLQGEADPKPQQVLGRANRNMHCLFFLQREFHSIASGFSPNSCHLKVPEFPSLLQPRSRPAKMPHGHRI